MTEEVVFVPERGALILPSGGLPGKVGPRGPDAFETWKITTDRPDATFEEYLDALEGPQGPPGPTGMLPWDEVSETYAERALEGVPTTFVGPVDPDSLGLMIDGDVWISQQFSDDPGVGLGDLADVDVDTEPPVDGQVLYHYTDSVGARWIPGLTAMLVLEVGQEVPPHIPAGVVVVRKM